MLGHIAITGAAGHLGQALTTRLAALPEVERVVALDLTAPLTSSPKVEGRVCDVRDAALTDHLRGCQAVIHLAFLVEQGARSEELAWAVNVEGTQNVFQAAVQAGVEQVVYTSSIASYGFHDTNAGQVLTEDAPLRGNDDFYYPRTKAAVESWLDRFEEQHPDLAIVRLRPSAFLASASKRQAAWTLRSPVFLYPSCGADVPAHMTHQEDVVDAVLLALRRKARGAYNVAAGDALPMREWGAEIGKRNLPLPAALSRVLGVAYHLGLSHIHPCWYTHSARHPIVVSSAKIQRELGWRPRYPTTGAALRAIARRPTARASRATRLLLGSAAWTTRLMGDLGGTAEERYESRTITGAMNLVFTGERPSEWHARFDQGRIGIHPGLEPTARATLTMPDAAFHDMLMGKLSYMVAQMTGKVRLVGDADFTFFMGAFVERFKEMDKTPGLAGVVQRTVAKLVRRAITRGAA